LVISAALAVRRYSPRDVRLEAERRRLKDFRAFVTEAWKIIEPQTEFSPGWHIDAICDHLVAVTDGRIRDLLINIPPRHAKSSIVSVLWPAWEWTLSPHQRYLCASYAGVLSTRDSLKTRRLITSAWYQELWGHVFKLTGDQNAKTRFENDRTGYRIATSVDAFATGEGGSRLIVDDPHQAQEAQSDTVRESTIDWWDNVMSTRRNDPKKDARVIIMQRLHEADLAGHVLKQGGWTHLNLPAEFEGDRSATSIGWSDPRKEVGELLWPARYGRKEIDELKMLLGPYGAAAQLQQRPSPDEGGILKKHWFRLWPAKDALPEFELIIQSYDTAFSERTVNDPTAQTAWGVFRFKRPGSDAKTGPLHIIMLDAWKEFLEYPELRTKARREWEARYGGKEGDPAKPGRRADIVLIEDKGSGITLRQDLNRAGLPVRTYNPGRADKVMRAHAATPFLAGGSVWIMESAKNEGKPISWAAPFLRECGLFPNGDEDDYVDTFTQAVIYLRDSDVLTAKVPGLPEDEEFYKPKPKRVNPYAQ
jgi:predicted phage terminase large subunit-like protein